MLQNKTRDVIDVISLTTIKQIVVSDIQLVRTHQDLIHNVNISSSKRYDVSQSVISSNIQGLILSENLTLCFCICHKDRNENLNCTRG